MNSLNKLSVKELKEKGIEMGLKMYGTKAQMVSKILQNIENLEVDLLGHTSDSTSATTTTASQANDELRLNLSKEEKEDIVRFIDVAINPDDSNSALNSNELFAVGDDGANEKKRKRNLVPYKQLGQYESVAMAIEAQAVEEN